MENIWKILLPVVKINFKNLPQPSLMGWIFYFVKVFNSCIFQPGIFNLELVFKKLIFNRTGAKLHLELQSLLYFVQHGDRFYTVIREHITEKTAAWRKIVKKHLKC